MSKKIIKLETNTWIQAYHIRNYELGILQTKTPWIFSKYINCYYNPQANSYFDHYMPEGRFFAKSKPLLVQKFKFDKTIFSLKTFDFLQWARQLINSGWCIMGYFDEYYIKCKTRYNKIHYRHSLLIYGYDDDTRLFYAIGYTNEKKYQPHGLTYDEFISAIGVEFDRQNEKFKKRDIDRIEFNGIKLNPNYEFQIDLKQLYNSLMDYIYSEADGNRCRNGVTYGLGCENEFVNYISNQRGEYLDIRYSRFFMELKELMVRRLEYLVNEKIVSQLLLDEYKKICESQKIIHLLFIKCNLAYKDNIIDQLIARMAEVISAEKKILPQIGNEIYAYLVEKHDEEYFL